MIVAGQWPGSLALADDNQSAELKEEAQGASAAAPELGTAEALPASDLDPDQADSTPRSRHPRQGVADMTSVTTAHEPGSAVVAVSEPATHREGDPQTDRAGVMKSGKNRAYKKPLRMAVPPRQGSPGMSRSPSLQRPPLRPGPWFRQVRPIPARSRASSPARANGSSG